MSRNEPITPSDAKRIVENATPDFGKEQGKKAPPVIGRTPRRPGAARYYARVYTDRATTTTGGQTQGQGHETGVLRFRDKSAEWDESCGDRKAWARRKIPKRTDRLLNQSQGECTYR